MDGGQGGWLDADDSSAASRGWWDAEAEGYVVEHGGFLEKGLIWGPEGLDEQDARLIGPSVTGLRILELGCGGAQGSRWLRSQGAMAVGLDLSAGMLGVARRLDGEDRRPYVHARGDQLPFASATFDAVVSAHGAFAFMADLPRALQETARVLRPGGRLVFSVTHPVRWAFPDDPGPAGLHATLNYFSREPYVERDEAGRAVYVEHHRTLSDTVEALVGANLRIETLLEPEWPEWNTQTWGAWSPLRGQAIPGTAIWVAVKPDPLPA